MQAIRTLILVSTLLSIAASTCDFSGYFSSAIGSQICTASNSFTLNGVSYAGYEFDAVSFDHLTITRGDIQGRIAVRNNFAGVNGSSVGDQITTDDGIFAIIAGGDISLDGEAFPLAQAIFVGGSAVNVPSTVSSRVTGTCSTSGCATAAFDNVFNYWTAFSNQLSAGVNNVDVTYADGVATLSCQSSTSSINFVNIETSAFNQIIGYTLANCASDASFVFNILGSGDVTFDGNSIVAGGYVVFNIAGSRTVDVVSSVNGNIVAPSATFTQVGGTVYGQVIAGDFANVIQINRPICPFGDAQSGSNFNSASACSSTSTSGEETVDTSSTSGDATTDSSTTNESVIDAGNADGNSGSIVAPIVSLVVIIAVMVL